MRQDTCALAAISLNIRQRLHPVIWSISCLPHDCEKLLPVPKPIGGVLLFACNSLTYLTQSVPPYGVSLNSMGDKNTNFPLSKWLLPLASRLAVRQCWNCVDILLLCCNGWLHS